MDKKVKKRNMAYEVTMVIAGTFLVIISIISTHMELSMLLDDESVKIIENACNAKDKMGNYSNDNIKCINNICYIESNSMMIASNCLDGRATVTTYEEYKKARDNASQVKDMCNHIDENGLYLNDRDDYCIDGICILKDDNKEYKSECPAVVAINDEDKIDTSTKKILQELCDDYQKGHVIKDEDSQYECYSGSCKVIDDSSITYSLMCEKKVYRVLDEDQALDERVINRYLDMACKKEEIEDERFKDNVRCSNGLCSFHYKQGNYFKKCDK